MYHPYLRGKQYELVMLRENARLIADAKIHPIIEPVRNDLSAVRRALDVLAGSGVACTLVVNPGVGELQGQTDRILTELFVDRPETWSCVDAGYIMHADSDIDGLVTRVQGNPGIGFTLIHGGYSDGRSLAAEAAGLGSIRRHVFLEGLAGKLYMRHFADGGVPRVLVRDGFQQQAKNAAYPPTDHFSDLHVTFSDGGRTGSVTTLRSEPATRSRVALRTPSPFT